MMCKKIHCEEGIEKSVPRDRRSSSLVKPCNAERQSSGLISLSQLTPDEAYSTIFVSIFKHVCTAV